VIKIKKRYLILLMFCFLLGTTNVQAISVQNSWELDPGYVAMNIMGEVKIPGDREIGMGFMLEGYLGSPEDRRVSLDLAYIKAPTSIGDFTLGKFRPTWEYKNFSSIMLSGHAPGMVGLQYEQEVFGLEYEKFFTWMSGMRGKLFGHRLQVPVIEGVKLGVKETVIYAEEFDGFWVNYLPLWPFYISRYIPGVPTGQNNHNIGIDLIIEPLPDLTIYADFHVTEYFRIPGQSNQAIYGLFLGGFMDNVYGEDLSLQVDYTRTTNYLYTHREEETFYEYKGRTLGTNLGPDGDRYSLLISFDALPHITLHGGYRFERKGEGVIGDYYPPREELKDSVFLSGVVEKRHIPVGGFKYQLSPDLDVEIMAELHFVRNFNHVEGNSGTRTAGTAVINWNF